MEDFVTYEIAKKLQAKGMGNNGNYGYNDKGEICVPVYNLDDDQVKAMCPCPQIHEVLKWLREEKKIFVAINVGYCYESDEIPFPTNPKMEPILKGYYYGIWELDNLNDKYARSEYFEDYEKAVIAGFEYVIDNLI